MYVICVAVNEMSVLVSISLTTYVYVRSGYNRSCSSGCSITTIFWHYNTHLYEKEKPPISRLNRLHFLDFLFFFFLFSLLTFSHVLRELYLILKTRTRNVKNYAYVFQFSKQNKFSLKVIVFSSFL